MTQEQSALIPNRPVFMAIDGHSVVYRAYFALAGAQLNLSLRSTGEPTGAVFNFVNMFIKAWRDVSPDYWAIAFDTSKPTFRDEMYDAYKAGRAKMPDELRSQIGRVRQVVEALSVPVLERDGFEADDIIGTLARRATERGMDTVIVTGDTDLTQLVNPHVRLRYQSFRGRSDTSVYDVAKVRERYGLEPPQIVDFKALTGDTSDNIPGVPGVGDKTATAMVQKYGTVTGIFERLDEVEVPRIKKIRELLVENREQLEMSRKLVEIDVNAPIEFDFEAAKTGDFDRSKVIETFRELEFNTLIARLPGLPQNAMGGALPSESDGDTDYRVVDDEAALDELLAEIGTAGHFALDVRGTSPAAMLADLAGLAVSTEAGKAAYIPLGHAAGKQLDAAEALERLRPVFEDEDVDKITHNGKYDSILLARHGIDLRGLKSDVTIAAYLLGSKALTVKAQALDRFKAEIADEVDVLGKGKKATPIREASIADAVRLACASADFAGRLWPVYEKDLVAENMLGLLTDLELELLPVLARMERAGVVIDTGLLHGMSREMAGWIEGIEREAYDSVGHTFKINSPKELSKLLFDEIGLKGLKRTTQGYSTDAATLEWLRGQHPVIEQILEYRQISKLKSTYVDALPEMVAPSTGRVHTTYSQTVAATGRLSSSDPNLQNIPVRTDLGKRVRDAFIAEPGSGWLLLSADYSQIELRILAHVTEDPGLIEAFRRDEDIHASTASRVFDTPLNEVTEDQRRFAKVVNFGLAYGMGEFGLASRADISREEAHAIMDEYFRKYPGIDKYLGDARSKVKDAEAKVREQGYVYVDVETLLGRRRRIAISKGANRQVLEAAERMAINHPIQGAAADVIKIGMINLQDRMDEAKLEARMLLQVHDELIFESPPDEMETLIGLVLEVMPKAMDLLVPLKVDLKQGRSWGEMA